MTITIINPADYSLLAFSVGLFLPLAIAVIVYWIIDRRKK